MELWYVKAIEYKMQHHSRNISFTSIWIIWTQKTRFHCLRWRLLSGWRL